MSEFKGTKGVWEIEETRGYHCDDNGIKINPIGFSFNEWDFDGDSDEIEENAKLIAAAPELLKALQKITEMNYQTAADQYGDRNKAKSWSCVTVAEAAIKKALE